MRAFGMTGRERAHDELSLELESLQRAQAALRASEMRVWTLVQARCPELAALLLDFWKNDEAALARWLCARRGEESPAELIERGRVKEVIAQVKWAASSAYV
ncbi:hypothetical protein [Lysobacter sp. HA18]